MNTIKHFSFFIIIAFIGVACSNTTSETSGLESGLIVISNQQFITDSMKLGKIEPKIFESIIRCNGIIVPTPDGMATISASVNGQVKHIYCYDGQWVETNQILIEIAGNEVFDLQKEFAEASASYQRNTKDFERVKSLYSEKVTSEKEFLLAETEFKTAMARYNGLKLKIETIGFSASTIENGEFYLSYNIKSPVKGYVSNLKNCLGSFVDSHTELLKIVNPEFFQVKLSIFPSDLGVLKKNQAVRIRPLNSNRVTEAVLRSIGVLVDTETRSVECYAGITNSNQNSPAAFEYVEAEIITATDTVMALPSEAIIKTENGTFVLMLYEQKEDNFYFKKVEVTAGKQFNKFSSVSKHAIDGLILTGGVYNIAL